MEKRAFFKKNEKIEKNAKMKFLKKIDKNKNDYYWDKVP